MSVELKLEHTFDVDRCRHYLNEYQSVLHCHHYATLYTKVALLAADLGGVEQLFKAGEEVFGRLLKEYFHKHGITEVEDRIWIACEYWKTVGMGLVEISLADSNGGCAKMDYSHIDEGWIKKWGGSDEPVNIFTMGFLAGASAAIFDKPFGTYNLAETKSLSRGDAATEFSIGVR